MRRDDAVGKVEWTVSVDSTSRGAVRAGLPAGTAPALFRMAQEQYCASLPMERYMQSAFSRSWSTASRLRAVSRSITSSGG